MAYEIDFVGSNIPKKDYDATCFRYTSNGRFVNCVFDGGTADAGDDLVNHIKKYYFKNGGNTIDYVFCSHADLDHASGLSKIFENFNVQNLVVNRPWDYLDELYDRVKDDRITRESLEKRLREKYPFVDALEKLATEKGCNIIRGVRGAALTAEMTIMSPTKEFYLNRLAESVKTPDMVVSNESRGVFSEIVKKAVAWISAVWGKDNIKEDVTTSAENEASIVLHVRPDGHPPFLYTGDAGCLALKEAIKYGNVVKKPLSACSFIQMPHHGGRHNVSPSILDTILGNKVEKAERTIKTAFVSVCKDSDHPKRCVVNAFINRGCAVFVCRGNTIWHHSKDAPYRGWGDATPEGFSSQVEDW